MSSANAIVLIVSLRCARLAETSDDLVCLTHGAGETFGKAHTAETPARGAVSAFAGCTLKCGVVQRNAIVVQRRTPTTS